MVLIENENELHKTNDVKQHFLFCFVVKRDLRVILEL